MEPVPPKEVDFDAERRLRAFEKAMQDSASPGHRGLSFDALESRGLFAADYVTRYRVSLWQALVMPLQTLRFLWSRRKSFGNEKAIPALANRLLMLEGFERWHSRDTIARLRHLRAVGGLSALDVYLLLFSITAGRDGWARCDDKRRRLFRIAGRVLCLSAVGFVLFLSVVPACSLWKRDCLDCVATGAVLLLPSVCYAAVWSYLLTFWRTRVEARAATVREFAW